MMCYTALVARTIVIPLVLACQYSHIVLMWLLPQDTEFGIFNSYIHACAYKSQKEQIFLVVSKCKTTYIF